MIISQSGMVDLVPEYNRALRPIFCVSEGDADSRMINLTVQNAGELFTIPESANVYVAGRKLDNTIFTYECSYSGYIVSFPISEQMSAVNGLVLCELQIVVAGDPLGSANFCYWVEPSPIANGSSSESDLNIFEQAIAALGGYEYLTSEVSVLSARMDQFARLPDGSLSTAADAELVDVRVMSDGRTAATAGDAVRGQYEELTKNLELINNNLISDGYAVIGQTGSWPYINLNTKKINVSSNGGARFISVPCKEKTTYVIRKPSSTHMLAASGQLETPTSGTAVPNAIGFAQASADPLVITTLQGDAYLYIQLWTSADPTSAKSVEANLPGLVVYDIDYMTRTMPILEDLNLIRKEEYTILSGGTYIGSGVSAEIYKNASLSDRTIQISIDENSTYLIYKNVPGIIRVGTGSVSEPDAGYILSERAMSTAQTVTPLYINSHSGDQYMYIQLFGDNDPSEYKSITECVKALSVYKIATNVNSVVDLLTETTNQMALLPETYAWGTLNQVARLGWRDDTPVQSIPSYKSAYRNGVKIMLADVRVTADGKYVCYHNDKLDADYIKTATGEDLTAAEKNQNVADLTLAQLDVYDYGIYKGSEYAGLKMMRLDEFLKLCANLNVWAFLEVKVPLTVQQITEVANMIISYKMKNSVVFGMSYYHYSGTEYNTVMEKLPNAKIAVLSMGNPTNFAEGLPIAQAYSSNGFDVYCGYANPDQLTAEVLAQCAANNLGLWYTEVTTRSQLDTMYESGQLAYYALVSNSTFNMKSWMLDKLGI